MNNTTAKSGTARRARKAPPAPLPPTPSPSRLDQLAALLTREDGATIADLTAATGWQQHSVRGAIAGALKKRGLAIRSIKEDGVRRYHATHTA